VSRKGLRDRRRGAFTSPTAVRDKIPQFSPGTTFGWQGDPADVEEFENLKAFAESHGMTIARERRGLLAAGWRFWPDAGSSSESE